MLSRSALISLSCLAVVAFTTNVEAKQPQEVTDINPRTNLIIVEDSPTNKQNWENYDIVTAFISSRENSQALSGELPSAKQWKPDNRVSNKKNYDSQKQLAATLKPGSYMTLMPMGRTNALGNPLYELRLYANGQLMGAYAIVTGRTHTQNRNRDTAGTEAPLPDGKYKVARAPILGTIPEAGDRFLPIQPLFQTGRSALGIHYDPSFEQDNGEDGTSGCIAVKNKSELDQVLNYVHTYQPKYLEVKIQ